MSKETREKEQERLCHKSSSRRSTPEMEGSAAMKCSVKDTFYIDPRVENCDDLTTRTKRLGLKTRGFLGADVTVCVVATAAATAGGADRTPGECGGGATAAAANPMYSRRRDRIHRMVSQAQSEPEPTAEAETVRQPLASITDRAHRLHALVLPGQVFRLWLEGLESKATANKGKATARPLISRGHQAGSTSRFKSQEHPRVVIKDMDGLEPDRVQAFPPELLRKCNLHTDAPPGICPFTPREQWEREVLRVKKKHAQSGAGKVADRTPPGPRKARRGGWCECCEKQYVGTMSEHCAGEQHRISVAADPNFEVLLALQGWTAADDEVDSAAATHGGAEADSRGAEAAAQVAQGRAHKRAVAPGPFGSAEASSGNLPSTPPLMAAATADVAASAIAPAASAATAVAPAAVAAVATAVVAKTMATDVSQSPPSHGAREHLAVIGRRNRNDGHTRDPAGVGGGAGDAHTIHSPGRNKILLPKHREPAPTCEGELIPLRRRGGDSPTRLTYGERRSNGADSTATKENMHGAAAAVPVVAPAALPPPSPSREREPAAFPGASATVPGRSPPRRRSTPGQPAEAVRGRLSRLGTGKGTDQPETAASVLRQHLVDAGGLKRGEVVSSPCQSIPCRGGDGGGAGDGGGDGDSSGGGGGGGGGGGRCKGGQGRQTGGSTCGGAESGRVPDNPGKEILIELRRKRKQQRALGQLADSPEFVGGSPSADGACRRNKRRRREGQGAREGEQEGGANVRLLLSENTRGREGAGVQGAGSPAERSQGRRPQRARKSPLRFRDEDEPRGTASCDSARKSGQQSGARGGARVPTPTTTNRMGLERSADASEQGDENGDCAGNADQSSPPSSGLLERTRSPAPRLVLERKFCEDRVSRSEVSEAENSRAKRTAGIGADFRELDLRGPPSKRTRSFIISKSSCTRSGAWRQQ